jgi:hypothetical protein
MITIEIGCKKHPRYKGAKRPINECQTCLELYAVLDQLASLARKPEANKAIVVKLKGVRVL